jgi:hypothetical protein
MRRLFLICAFLLPLPAEAGLRAPSCDALAAFSFGARISPIEISFGKPPDDMTVDEFEQAIDIVFVCIDEIESGPADIRGLTWRERKSTRIGALARLAEDLKIYRSRQRERERREAEQRR